MRSDPTLPEGRIFAGRTPKHAPVAGPAAGAEDLRSVGELLVDADHHARTLLLDAEAEAAPGLLRSWANTVTAAAALWGTFPGQQYVGEAGRRLLERVTELAISVEADLATARWPGDGSGDHRMHAIVDDLTRARELVGRYAGDVATHLPAVHKDLEAARTRVVHTLYIATHGVVVALSEDGRQRAKDPSRIEALRAAASTSRGRYEVGPGVRWADRLGVAERTLGSYLHPGRYVQALSHEQTAPVVGLTRLEEALARFDIQVHRTLVEAPNPGNLVLATRTEGMFFGAALVLARAADETGHLDQAAVDPARLERGLTAAGEAWSGLARRWRDLMPAGARLDPALGAAAAQLRAACRELSHEHDHLADVATIAQRVDLTATVPVIARYVDAAAELAEATKPALRRSDLVAPARAVARRLAEDIEARLIPEDANALRGDVIALAARSNRLMPVPVQLIEALASAAAQAGNASAAAANSMSTGTKHRTRPADGPTGEANQEPRHTSVCERTIDPATQLAAPVVGP